MYTQECSHQTITQVFFNLEQERRDWVVSSGSHGYINAINVQHISKSSAFSVMGKDVFCRLNPKLFIAFRH